MSISLIISLTAQSQDTLDLQESPFHLHSVTIVAKDIKLSATWYRKYLNIEIKEYKPQKHVKMICAGFQLNIKQGNNVLLASQIKLPKGKKTINGISKIGFSISGFNELYNRLVEENHKIIEEITFDKNLNVNYFTTTDPDGNKIQLFEQKEGLDTDPIKAMFFSITSSDYINTMKWYENYIDFTEVETKDESKIHFQNLLHKDNVIFEIIHLPHESVETTEFMPVGRVLAGFTQIAFQSKQGKISSFEMDNNANRIKWLK